MPNEWYRSSAFYRIDGDTASGVSIAGLIQPCQTADCLAFDPIDPFERLASMRLHLVRTRALPGAAELAQLRKG
jgi:hypothetical protein